MLPFYNNNECSTERDRREKEREIELEREKGRSRRGWECCCEKWRGSEGRRRLGEGKEGVLAWKR